MTSSNVILLAGALAAWLMMLRSWHAWLEPRLDARVDAARARGKRPMPIRGLANYEQAEVADRVQRDGQTLLWERAVGLCIGLGVPLAMLLVAFWSMV